MDMPSALLLMHDHGTRLTGQAELFFSLVRRLHHVLDRGVLTLGRVQAEREHELLALRRL